MVGCITYKFMRSNLKEFDNQKAFSAFVGFTIKTLSTRSYAIAEALEMHLLKKFRINVHSWIIVYFYYYFIPLYNYQFLEHFLRFHSKINENRN